MALALLMHPHTKNLHDKSMRLISTKTICCDMNCSAASHTRLCGVAFKMQCYIQSRSPSPWRRGVHEIQFDMMWKTDASLRLKNTETCRLFALKISWVEYKSIFDTKCMEVGVERDELWNDPFHFCKIWSRSLCKEAKTQTKWEHQIATLRPASCCHCLGLFRAPPHHLWLLPLIN